MSCCKKKVNKLCSCEENNFNDNCTDKLCKNCCTNKKCSIHNKLCLCKKNNFNKDCYNKLCDNCCKDTENCKEHFIDCKCGGLGNKCCNSKSCDTCCKDYDCEAHYIQSTELTTETLDEYKKIIYNYKIKLPIEFINYIVDEFIDYRPACCYCQIKKDYNDSDLTTCEKCTIFICYGCIFNTSISSYKYYERYCYTCKELYSISLNSHESFSMHHEIVEEKNLRRNGMKRYNEKI